MGISMNNQAKVLPRSPRVLTMSSLLMVSFSSSSSASCFSTSLFLFSTSVALFLPSSTRYIISSSIFLARNCDSLRTQDYSYIVTLQVSRPIPYSATILRATWQIFCRSSEAPELAELRKISSLVSPPIMMAIWSISSSLVLMQELLGRYCAQPRAPLERGMMVSLIKGSPPFKNHPHTACPAQWQATLSLVLGFTRFFFSQPAVMRSEASQKSFSSMYFLSLLVAIIAAQLQRLAMSAPLNPGLSSDSLFARSYSFLLGSILSGLRWTLKISSLALMSGKVTSTILSNRPGRVSAESRTSFLLVAASTITVQWLENPSISTSSWLRVESFSSFLEVYLFLPIASISSMKMIDGASILALANSSLTFEAPSPTNISTNYDPEMQKKVTPASPAQALANIVLPVPGGPVSSAPLGILAPISRYFSPCFKKSTNSVISFLACSMPATSANLTLMSLSPSILKLFLFEIFEIIESGVNFLKIQQVMAMPMKGVTRLTASPKVFQKLQAL